MKSKSLDFIVTAGDHARAHNCSTVKAFVKQRIAKVRRQSVISTPFVDVSPVGVPAIARIDWGQWIADCPEMYCNGAEFVDPDEPMFYCFSCGNRGNNGKPRPVKFPPKATRKKIEALVLARPVMDMQGLSDLDRARRAVPQIRVNVGGKVGFLARNWSPPDTVKDLEAQNKAIDLWKNGGGKLGVVKMNSWAVHPTVVTGQTWSASDQNTYVKGNFAELQSGFTAKGDIAVGISSTELGRIAAGNDGQIIVYDSSESSGARVGQLPISLSVASMILPSTGGTACSVQLVNSTDTASPIAHWHEALFDDTQSERGQWVRVLPSLMGASPVVRVHAYMATATSGNIGFQVHIAAKSDGDASITAKAFGSANAASEAVPGTAKTKFVLDVPITDSNSWAKDDEVIIDLARNVGVTGNASGDCVVTYAQLVYG